MLFWVKDLWFIDPAVARKVYLSWYSLETKQCYSITGWLKFWSKKYHSFSFYDRNKYRPLANDNPKQYLESCIYDPNKYQKMWKRNLYLRHIPVHLYIGSDPPGF